MRAALVLSEVLSESDDPQSDLDRLVNAGLRPVVVEVGASRGELIETGGYSVVSTPQERPECWSDSVGLLSQAAARVGARPAECAVFCAEATDVERAVSVGCRAVLVLGARTIYDVYGHSEPQYKSAPSALTFSQAVDFIVQEHEQDLELEPFPYGAQPVEGSVMTVMPSRRDLVVFFGLVTVAGMAVALGVAYLLQEAYQTLHLPPIAYWLTLQFIDQTWRGVMFLIIGVGIGVMAALIIPRILLRQRTRGT